MLPLFKQLEERLLDDPRGIVLWPPVSESELDSLERRLGFALPETLRALLSQLAGGVPSIGLLGVDGRCDLWKAYRSLSDANWPARLLPVVYCGAGSYLCVDCSDADSRVVQFDPAAGLPPGDEVGANDRLSRPYPDHPSFMCFREVAPSLERLLENWLADNEWPGCLNLDWDQ
jgi:hypothetical protein